MDRLRERDFIKHFSMENMIKCEFLNNVIDTGILARRNALNECINTDQNYDLSKSLHFWKSLFGEIF